MGVAYGERTDGQATIAQSAIVACTYYVVVVLSARLNCELRIKTAANVVILFSSPDSHILVSLVRRRRPVGKPGSEGVRKSQRRRRDNRGGEEVGFEEGVPPPRRRMGLGRELGPLPRKFLSRPYLVAKRRILVGI